MLKQKMKAGGIKIKRYDDRCQQFKQNQQFRNNQKLFYEALDGKKREGAEQPDPIEATTFWRRIWSEEVCHNERASWLEEVEQEFSTTEVQENINITIDDIRTGLRWQIGRQLALVLFRVIGSRSCQDYMLDCHYTCKTV